MKIQNPSTEIKKIYSLIDLTSLNENDNEEIIRKLCLKANSPLGHVAAVCIYPSFITLTKQALGKDSPVKIATVCNFPAGTRDLSSVLMQIETATAAGADELDVVFPYPAYLSGNSKLARHFVTACKEACGSKLLKVILETGALQQPEMIAQASQDVILAGADFIKTSTGKIEIGATLETAKIMLEVIRDLKLKRTVGFKAAGGIRTIDQALEYLYLAETIMGSDWISPQTFRIGASRLVDELLNSDRLS